MGIDKYSPYMYRGRQLSDWRRKIPCQNIKFYFFINTIFSLILS